MIDPSRVICRLDEIASPGSRAFTLGAGDWPLRGFVVRDRDVLRAYVNRCPHAGHPLDLIPDRFLSQDGEFIQCSSHGALFALTTGLCVAGPCAGRGLERLQVRVSEGWVIVEENQPVSTPAG